jgi:hypothetical protein
MRAPLATFSLSAYRGADQIIGRIASVRSGPTFVARAPQKVGRVPKALDETGIFVGAYDIGPARQGEHASNHD